MYLNTRGLVIRITKYNDTDALLTVLTPNHGKLTLKARGLYRKNSPLTASCQLLAFSEFTLFEYRDQYTINEAKTVELFRGLRRDLSKLSLGTYFAQVADVVSQEDAPGGELLSLVLNCLYAITATKIPHQQIKAVFEMRCAALAGFMPDLSGCNHCGSPTPHFLDISQGILECSGCRDHSSDGIRIPVNESLLAALQYICYCHPKKLFSFQMGEKTLEQLSALTEAYLSTQLERGFSALDFYKSLYI